MKMQSCAVDGLGAESMDLGLIGSGSEAQYMGLGVEWSMNHVQC